MQFKPTNPALLEELARTGSPARLTSIGSTQLRFEGIDALELHFGGSFEPRPLAYDARDFLTAKLHLDPVLYTGPGLTSRQAAGRARRHVGLHPLARAGGARPAGLVRLRRGRRPHRTAPSWSSTPPFCARA